MQLAFTLLLTLQFLVVVLHDWLDIPGWTHGKQMQQAIGRNKLAIATVINALFPGLAVALAWLYWNQPNLPANVIRYQLLYCTVTVASAIAMWYIPYFFGCSEKTRNMYTRMYAGTYHILPARGDNPRPNLLHIAFHFLFAATFGLSLALWIGAA